MSEVRPTTGDVAVVLRSYTRGRYGGELGDFDESTSPTKEQVEAVIDHVMPLVTARLGSNLPGRLVAAAKSVATLRAAMGVVRSLMREGDGAEAGLYEAIREEYQEALRDFDAAARGDSSVDVGRGSGMGSIGAATVYEV